MPARPSDEQGAFRRLFDDAYQPLLGYALRRAENATDAEEVVAETLLVAWRRRAELPAGAETVPWLYGVARRVLANQRRGRERRRRLATLLRPLARSSVAPDDRVEHAEDVRAVLAALRRLPTADQEVLRLAAWEGLSHHEIATNLGCSENAAALRLHRARQRLRKELMKEGRFPGQEVVEVTR